MQPRSKHWHLIDNVITRRKDRQEVRFTKAMSGADCWIDHRLIVSKFNFCILPRRHPQGKKTLKRLDVAKLKQDKIVEELSVEFNGKLQNFQLEEASVEDG